ncbi:hypothetical protein HGM15179_020536 [Zosterops borbonicus]|uniref:Uncharacterized protein n=1 Tax=Zosterops borbonicus TaxID=364589 RepID=A0A8K1DA41_9PASS|nr:hypothetical protein HGM15179_020536 [Zosterops borbonicus]
MALAPAPGPPESPSAGDMERYYRLLRAAALLEAAAETAIPICAKDISDDLMKEFAFLSGGRGKDKAWIITLPDNAGFNEMPEENVSKVLTYLTSVPSLKWSDVWTDYHCESLPVESFSHSMEYPGSGLGKTDPSYPSFLRGYFQCALYAMV